MAVKTTHNQREAAELTPPQPPSLQTALRAALEELRAAKRAEKDSVTQPDEAVRLVKTFARSCLYKRYPSKKPADIDDITQEVLMKVWRAIESFDGARPAHHWLSAITLRTAVDGWRSEGKGRLSVLDGGGCVPNGLLTFEFVPDESHNDPAELFFEAEHAREISEATRGAIAKLPPVLRQVIELNLQDTSPSGIAEVLGIPEGTAKSRLHAARAHLRKALQGIARE